VVIVLHKAVDHFTLAVEIEHEGVQVAVLTLAEFVLRGGLGLHALDNVNHRPGSFYRSLGLGARIVEETAGVIDELVVLTVSGIGQPFLRPDGIEHTAAEAAPQDIVHHNRGRGIIVGNVPADMSHADIGLIDIGFFGVIGLALKVVFYFRQRRDRRVATFPVAEILVNFSQEFLAVKITPDRQLDVFRAEPFVVEVHKVVTRNGFDGGVLCMASILGSRGIDDLVELATSDNRGIIVAA